MWISERRLRRIIREELEAFGPKPVVNVVNPIQADPVKATTEAAKLAKAYAGLA